MSHFVGSLLTFDNVLYGAVGHVSKCVFRVKTKLHYQNKCKEQSTICDLTCQYVTHHTPNAATNLMLLHTLMREHRRVTY